MNKETTIFIDTEDMEERYGEELYKEYLEKENKQLKQENEKLKEKNTIYKSTIKGQYNKIKELQNAKRISKEVHKKRNKKLQEENERLKEENFNLREGIYIEKMSFPSEGRNFKELMEMPTYEELKKENEKLNHYKLLYQKVKDRNDKAIEKIDSFIECCKCEKLESGSDYLHHSYWNMFDNFNKQVREILKGNEE